MLDRLFVDGQAAVSAGKHGIQTPPVEGAPRWGLSVLLRPDPASAENLARTAHEAASIAGGRQWITGAKDSVHLTMRTLEPWRETIASDDVLMNRYAHALAVAAAQVGPLRFDVVGLTLTPGSVMAHAVPVDEQADRLADAYTSALGENGWYENNRGILRDFWYLNLLHFADAIQHPEQLITWITERRDHDIATVVVDEVQLVQWRYSGSGMHPVPVTTARLI
ncbi:hypothetical protein [Actinoplanes subglobosus]|uniref:Uncharacterized protein n=1 Tax=Actinoplanes subglobosus TaxID=1547892 RepID=A0ABV8JCU3_9ACTN